MHPMFNAVAIAAATASLLAAMPASAMSAYAPSGAAHASPGEEAFEHGRKHRHDHRHSYYDGGSNYTKSWRGRDGRYYCKKKDGTTGMLIGGAAGALLGRAVDTQGDRAPGTIIGAAGGALLGRSIERNGSCR